MDGSVERRRWIRRPFALGLAAAAAGLASGALYAALHVDISEPPRAAMAAEPSLRRHANERLPRQRIDLPLRRLSRIHLVVDADLRARGTSQAGPWSRHLAAEVVLDTGASVPFATAEIGALWPLRTAPESRPARSFSGARGALYPLEVGELLSVVLGAGEGPNAVTAPVQYVAPAALYGAHLVAPPRGLAPIGGAVALDLEQNRFSICESLAACLDGGGYRLLARRRCAEEPELDGIDVVLGGRSFTMQLDTGAPTLLFRGHFEPSELEGAIRDRQAGDLSGSAGAVDHAELLTGSFHFTLGADRSIERDGSLLWVVGPPGASGPSRCFPAGSIGTDLLDGCRIVLGEPGAFLRCPPPAEP